MALEREKTNVAIGNMPYVRPSNVLGSLAKEVQQEAVSYTHLTLPTKA